MVRVEKPISRHPTHGTTFNLKNIFDKVEEERPEILQKQEGPRDEFSEQKLREAWNELLNSFQERNQIPVYNALHTAKLSYTTDFQIKLEFSSASSEAEFNLQKEKISNFLREKLNNHSIEFFTNVSKSNDENYVLTTEEKFRKMAEKNPILWKLKEHLGLDYNSHE